MSVLSRKELPDILFKRGPYRRDIELPLPPGSRRDRRLPPAGKGILEKMQIGWETLRQLKARAKERSK